MDPADILRFADVVHRDRGIEKEIVFGAIEQGLLTAARKRFGEDAVIEVRLDRRTGEIDCLVGGRPAEVEFGRIAAQTARQVMNQRIREAERDKHLDEYNRRLNSIVTGTIQRIESGNLIVNMGRVEGIVPRSEQIRIGHRRTAGLVAHAVVLIALKLHQCATQRFRSGNYRRAG